MNRESQTHLSDRPRVVIVGGGLAGMSSAESIARGCEDKLAVEVFEARRTTGGRAGSFQDAPSGVSVDYCQHVAMGCCTNFLGLLDRCGQLEQWTRCAELEFRFPNTPPSHFVPLRLLPPPFHLIGALFSIRYLQWKQVLRVANALWRLMRTPTSEVQNVTAADWLLRHGQDAVLRERFWDVILVSALAESPETVSMAAARKVIIDGFAAARGAADVLIPRQPLSQLFGQQLPRSIERLGVEFHHDSQVTDLVPTHDGHVRVHCCNQEPVIADHVIVATAWHSSAKLLAKHLPKKTVDGFGNVRSSPISGVHLWFDRELTDRAHAVLVGSVSQWLFRPARDPNIAAEDFYYQVVISASADVRGKCKEELLEAVVNELQQFFPAARDAKLIRSRVVTDPNSVFSVSAETEGMRPCASTPLPWLHLAGDWTATGWPSTMEGAVISGRMATNSVLKRLDLGTVKIDPGLNRGFLARLLIKN